MVMITQCEDTKYPFTASTTLKGACGVESESIVDLTTEKLLIVSLDVCWY